MIQNGGLVIGPTTNVVRNKRFLVRLFDHDLSRDVCGQVSKSPGFLFGKIKKSLVHFTRRSAKRFPKLNYEWQTVYSASHFSSAD